MPKLTVEGVGEFVVPNGKRLVLALRDEVGIDQLHSCGGQAKCTTCRVEFLSGEPAEYTPQERAKLEEKGLAEGPSRVRLSCQIYCNSDMSIRAKSRLEGSGKKDCGTRPPDII